MALVHPIDRDVYRSTGRVRLFSLFSGAVMATLAGLLISVLMALLSAVGFYFILLVPLVAGMLAGYLSTLVVKQSHCRNVLLASLLGALVGAVAYLGHYHFEMLRVAGFEHWHRVDVLPEYIWARWHVDTIRNSPPWFPLNVTISVGEFVLMSAFAAYFAFEAARRPYSEVGLCWMTSQGIIAPSGAGRPLAEALNTKSPEAIAAAILPDVTTTPLETAVPDGYSQYDFWMCPPARDPERADDIYLTITEFAAPDKEGNRKQTAVAHLWTLEPAEVVLFAKTLPVLAEWLKGSTGSGTGEEDEEETEGV